MYFNEIKFKRKKNSSRVPNIGFGLKICFCVIQKNKILYLNTFYQIIVSQSKQTYLIQCFFFVSKVILLLGVIGWT